MNKKNLIWIDLEMTGLNPEIHRIIEISTLVTDEKLNILAEGPEIIIYQEKKHILSMDLWNQKVHKKNGLIKKVHISQYDEKYAERKIISFLKKLVPIQSSPMCGNSIYQDRLFLRKHMPSLENYFHYRCIDVSTIKELASIWHPQIKKEKKNTHTAKHDIYESIKELRFYKKTFFDNVFLNQI